MGMIKRLLLSMVIVLFSVGTLIADESKAESQKNLKELELQCQQTIAAFRKTQSVDKLFANSYAQVVFPTIGEGAFIIGASYGKGLAYVGGAPTGISKVGGISIGLQAGGQAYSQIVFLKNKTAYELFTTGKFSFGAGAKGVAITTGATAKTSTTGTSISAKATNNNKNIRDLGYDSNGMVVVVYVDGGLMASVALDGQNYTFQNLK